MGLHEVRPTGGKKEGVSPPWPEGTVGKSAAGLEPGGAAEE